jgi:hypothetical protein
MEISHSHLLQKTYPKTLAFQKVITHFHFILPIINSLLETLDGEFS